MTDCYSASGRAPLNALANQLLGESSFAPKNSLFQTGTSSQHQHSFPHTHSHIHLLPHSSSQIHHNRGLFPSQSKQPSLISSSTSSSQPSFHKLKSIDSFADPFEQAWSRHSSKNNLTFDFHHTTTHDHHLPDMNLIHAWEMHHQEQHVPDHQVQTTLSGISAASPPDFNASEFESFQYLPTIDGSSIHVEKQESVWAQEWSRHEQETAESDDEDEFREEWSNDHFTQAYINSHQSQFRAIEEQDCLKEARLEEERERLRQASGGPPRSAWLMAGVTTISEQKTAGGETGSTLQPPRRLPVPRLDPLKQEIAQEHQHSMFSIDEFMSFDYHHDYNQPQTTLQPSLRPSNPVQAKDRFMTLVSDLHLAEQTFYPGATSATSNEMDDTAAFTSTMHPQIQTGWSQEFEGNNQVKHRGAEWNWEKTFGKDPRRQMKATEAHLVISREKNGDLDESERLKAVALTRLQALFGHLSFTPPTS